MLEGSSGLTGDWFIGYLVVFSQIIPPARSISDGWFRIQKGSASLERLEEILSADEMTDECVALTHPLRDGIRFEGVLFSYGDQTVLNGIDLSIAKGETVALVLSLIHI